MSSTDRQNQLIAAEDWKKIYQTLKNADFKSYDFDTLRRTMISYLRINYPEDFNDYVESSEYLALIDLIAFLGQNLAFRFDLNARENFIELAERRESLLRLARLLAYNPKRAVSASGLLKLTSVTTDEDIFDSNGRNLANQPIVWNDTSNSNWYEQFIKVINAALPSTAQFGKPEAKKTIEGVPTEQYRFNTRSAGLPVFAFQKSVGGRTMPFEIVSSSVKEQDSITEEAPALGNPLAFLYRDDGQGSGSNNNGFFALFKQGVLQNGTFNITSPKENDIVDLDASGINDSDVWLYKLSSAGIETDLWTRVDALKGSNIIYNSLNKNIKNIYATQTRTGDRVSLTFSDGVFGNIPKGTFKTYYRIANGLSYTISPNNIKGITLDIKYVSKTGKQQTISLTFSLKYSVTNAAERETNDEIRRNAPMNYYVQNRMITGEDYNTFPLTVSQSIIKVKAVNRTSTGISRYLDLLDSSGKYSSTNIYGNDGVVYREPFKEKLKFSYISRTDIDSFLTNTVEPLLATNKVKDFFYTFFAPIDVSTFAFSWYSDATTNETNRSTGYVGLVSDSSPRPVGPPPLGTTGVLRYVAPGSLLKFSLDTDYYFDKNNQIVGPTPSYQAGYKDKIWSKVVHVDSDGTADGTGILDTGLGPISLNDIIPEGAFIQKIFPKFVTKFSASIKTRLGDYMFENKTFGIRYDYEASEYKIIDENNLNKFNNFTLNFAGDTSRRQKDSSWLFKFEVVNGVYEIIYRAVRYVFESDKEVRFFYDSSDRVYDAKSGKLVKDQIKVMSINTKPDSLLNFANEYAWTIVEGYKGSDGYQDSKKIEVSFFDSDDDGVIDNPELFTDIVDPEVNTATKIVFMKRYSAERDDFYYDATADITVVDKDSDIADTTNIADGDLYYIINTNLIKQFNRATNTFSVNFDYQAFLGRADIKFHYIHAADNSSRIDPSTSNFIDMYVLTKQYDTDYRNWLKDTTKSKPLPLGSTDLAIQYGSMFNKYKAISDEIVLHPVKYRNLFGQSAASDLQAKFVVVKNPDIVVNDNDVKVSIINSINTFFALDNWDFGEQFWFQELSTYVMKELSPKIVNFIIVPKQSEQAFGSLFQIEANSDEIFISSASVDDIEIVDNLSAYKLNTNGLIITEVNRLKIGVESSPSTSTDGEISY